jgi:hypothetical protein
VPAGGAPTPPGPAGAPTGGGGHAGGPRAAGPPAPAPGAPKPKRRRSRRSSKPGVAGFVADKGIPLLIAILGLVAALATTYGAIVTSRANDAEAANTRLKRQVADLDDTNDSLTTDNSDLEAQIADLNAKVDDLEGQLADTPTTTVPDEDDPSTGPTSPGEHPAAILRQTGTAPVVFSDGYSIDLDSPAPDWDVHNGTSGDIDFYLSGTTPHLGTPELSIVTHVPTKAECDDATVLQPNFPQELVQVGTQICTRTYGGQHIAYVHIADIDVDAGTITLDLIVWR